MSSSDGDVIWAGGRAKRKGIQESSGQEFVAWGVRKPLEGRKKIKSHRDCVGVLELHGGRRKEKEAGKAVKKTLHQESG